MRYILLFLFTMLLWSCSSTLHKSQEKKAPVRALASEASEGWKQCYMWKKKSCFKKHPYQSVKRKWYEFEYQYLNRRNKLHVEYNQCVIEAGKYCSEKYEQYETAQVMDTLKSEQKLAEDLKEIAENSLWKNISIPGIDLSSEKIRQIFEFVTRMKAIHTEIVAKVEEGGYQIQESSLNALHGFGLSLTGSAFAGLGVEIRHEAVIHDGIMAVFCAPGLEVITDVGIALELSLVKTLGCMNNAHYKGKFLSMSFGASAETLGLPVSGSVSYSLGVNLTKYLQNMVKLKKTGQFSTRLLAKEIIELSSLSSQQMIEMTGNPQNAWSVLFFSQFLSRSIEEKDPSLELNRRMKEIEEDKMPLENIKSLSHLLKLVVQNAMTSPIFKNGGFPNLFLALHEMTKQMSGCDSANLSAGLSLSLAPVSAGFSMHHYYRVAEVDLRDVLYLATFGPRALMTLNLEAKEFERFKKALMNILNIIPDYLYNKCVPESTQKFYLDGKNIIELMKED